MKNFETFIGIDWSGAKSPIHTKSIAVAMCRQGHDVPELIQVEEYRNAWSRKRVFEYIQTFKERTLIGIDANFGYSEQIGLQQFKKSYDYNDLWRAVEQTSSEHDNFFAGGFWQAHPKFFWTQGKKPLGMQFPKRLTERLCSEAEYGNPESPFKLIGAKQVGKGGLAAMRMAHALKEKMGDAICIWPFEQKIIDTAQIVMTEIFPRQFLMRTGHGVKKITTLDDLNTSLHKLGCENKYETRRFSSHDTDAIVSSAGLRMLCGHQKTIPERISHPVDMNEAAIKREGWIFGVGDKPGDN